MNVNRDFRDLFAALNDAGARYLVIGGYALAFHARPRYTKDLDVLVEPTPDNAQRVYKALYEFGAPLDELTEAELRQPGVIFQMEFPPNRIDILTGIDGVGFDEAWPDRQESQYGDQPIHVMGRDHLIMSKLAAGRPQDLNRVVLSASHVPGKAERGPERSGPRAVSTGPQRQRSMALGSRSRRLCLVDVEELKVK